MINSTRFLGVFLLFIVLLIGFSFPPEAFANQQIPILMYHYIRDYNYPNDPKGQNLSVSPANFDAQMQFLVHNGYTTISLDTLYAVLNNQAASQTKPIVITFDDGYIDFYTNAYPILKKYNLQAISFVVTSFVGRPAYLTWDNIHEMTASGLVAFEAHTMSHAYLPALDPQVAFYELLESKTTIEKHLGYPVNFVAYPYGASNSSVQYNAQKAGFVAGIGTWYGKASTTSMNMPRVRINGEDSLESFASKL